VLPIIATPPQLAPAAVLLYEIVSSAQLLGKGTVTMRTLFEAPGMTEPKPLFAIRELRWWVATGLGEALRTPLPVQGFTGRATSYTCVCGCAAAGMSDATRSSAAVHAVAL